jgi:hypothetical protein
LLAEEGWNEGGKPRLGENHKVEVHIKESKAIKVNTKEQEEIKRVLFF